jgi:hypothetical protein
MQSIGKYHDRQVYWLDYDSFSNELPDKDWVCLAIANRPPDFNKFDTFVRTAIAKNILEFNPDYAVDFVNEIQNTKEDEHSRKFRARSRGHLHVEHPKRASASIRRCFGSE